LSTHAARLRLADFQRRTLGVDVSAAVNLVARFVTYFSLTFLFPMVLAIGYGERVWPYLAAGGITAGVGLGLQRITRGGETIGAREGFLVVALTWALGAWVVALPYMLGEPQLRNPVDAYFEAMSGMTTTGATTLTDVSLLDKSMAMWRQFSQWLGGMGIVVLALAVLPRLRVGGSRQLVESEMPGHEYEALTATIRDTARRLWLVYVGLSAAMVLLLAVFGWTGVDDLMTEYQAAAHMFTAMPTGGFSPQPRSIEPFAAASQYVIAIFMLLAGASFALHYRAIVRRASPFRDEEFRLYLVFIVLATAGIFLELVRAGIYDAGEAAFRHSVVNVVSMMTTTGFVSVDYTHWTGLTSFLLMILMLVGGCAGSTGGAIKVARVALTGKILRRELDQTVHREAVVPIRLNRRVVDERTVRAVLGFVLLYLILFLGGAFVLAIESARAGLDVSPFVHIGSAATTLGNVGPSFGFAGPMGSFDEYSPLSKTVMSILMWAGRLEIIPVAVLLTRRYWRA
jgi:trk system potassium uptake protein TrkH